MLLHQVKLPHFKHSAESETVKPVSYTHLDVYKRQTVYLPINIQSNFACGGKMRFRRKRGF